MAKVDELGIELDEDLERAMADPKSAILSKAVDYLLQRREVKREKEQEERKKAEKKDSLFNGMFE